MQSEQSKAIVATSTDSASGSVATNSSRVAAIDLVRGLALLGMMAVHALWDTAPDGTPTLIYSIAGGRSAVLFAVLAGVSLAFLTGRKRLEPGFYAGGVAAGLLARALVIMAVGLMLSFVDPDIVDVILPYYGVLFILAMPLLFLPTRGLLALCLLIVCLIPLGSHWLRPYLPFPEQGNPSFGRLFSDPAGLACELLLTGYYPALPWLAYVCAGISVGRMRLASRKTALQLLVSGTALAGGAIMMSWLLLHSFGGLTAIYAAAGYNGLSRSKVSEMLAFGLDGLTPTASLWWLATAAPHSATPFEIAHGIGCALAVIGATLLVSEMNWADRPFTKGVLSLLRAAGAMTLTIYVAHATFMSSPLDVFSAVGGYTFQVIVALAFAGLWRHNISPRGPLETIVSGIARWARRSARREPEVFADARNSSGLGSL